MDFQFTEEQLMIQSVARDFAQNEIAPVAAEFDASGEFPRDTIRQAGELGFMGIEVPETYGGAGLDSVSFVLGSEAHLCPTYPCDRQYIEPSAIRGLEMP